MYHFFRVIFFVLITISSINAFIIETRVNRNECNNNKKECQSLALSMMGTQIYSTVSSQLIINKIKDKNIYSKIIIQNINLSSKDVPLIMVRENLYKSNDYFTIYEMDSEISGIHYQNTAKELFENLNILIKDLNTENTYIGKKNLYENILTTYKKFILYKLMSNFMSYNFNNKPIKRIDKIIKEYASILKENDRALPEKSNALRYHKKAKRNK